MMLLILLTSLASLLLVSSIKVYEGPLEPLCRLQSVTPQGVLQKNMFLGTVEMSWSNRRLTPDTEFVAIMVNGPFPHYYRRHIFQVRDKDGKPFGTFDRDMDVCLVNCPPGKKNTAYYVRNSQHDLLAVWYPPKYFTRNDTAVLHLSAYLDEISFWNESFPVPKRVWQMFWFVWFLKERFKWLKLLQVKRSENKFWTELSFTLKTIFLNNNLRVTS